ERSQQLPRMPVAADERRPPVLRVGLDDEHARELFDGGRGAVVEDGDRSVRLAARVVLPGEVRAGPHLEAALPAPEPPEDLAGLAADLVDRVRVAGGDDEVAVVVDVDGVDVEVVPRGRVLAGRG